MGKGEKLAAEKIIPYRHSMRSAQGSSELPALRRNLRAGQRRPAGEGFLHQKAGGSRGAVNGVRRSIMKKDLNYYMSLPYKIEIFPIPESEGGGYMARLPQFGRLGIVGDGASKAEALADLEENQRDRFEQYLEEGLTIPEPEPDPDRQNYSGRFVLRIPKFLHRELAESARQNSVSLNQYVCTLLALNFQTIRKTGASADLREESRPRHPKPGAVTYQTDDSL